MKQEIAPFIRRRYEQWEQDIKRSINTQGFITIEDPTGSSNQKGNIEISVNPPLERIKTLPEPILSFPVKDSKKEEIILVTEIPEKKEPSPSIVAQMLSKQHTLLPTMGPSPPESIPVETIITTPGPIIENKETVQILSNKQESFVPYFNEESYLTTDSFTKFNNEYLDIHVELPGTVTGELWLYPFGERKYDTLGIAALPEKELIFVVTSEEEKEPSEVSAKGTLLCPDGIYYICFHTFTRKGSKIVLADLELPCLFTYFQILK